MFVRIFLLAVLICGNSASGLTQTIADSAREERARRQALADAARAAAEGPMPVGHDALLQEALRLSGAGRQLQQVVETAFQSATRGKPPDGISTQEYQQIMLAAFDGQRLMPVMEKSISDAVSDQTLVDVVRWYRSAQGKRIAGAELSASGPDASVRMQSYASRLLVLPPPQSRTQLVQQLEAQTQSSSKTVQMLLSVMVSIFKGIMAAGVPIPPPPPDFEDTFRAQVSEPMRQGMIISFLFTYDSLTDVDLAGYLNFLKTPSAMTFNNSIWDGMNTAFGDAGMYIGRSVAQKKIGIRNGASLIPPQIR